MKINTSMRVPESWKQRVGEVAEIHHVSATALTHLLAGIARSLPDEMNEKLRQALAGEHIGCQRVQYSIRCEQRWLEEIDAYAARHGWTRTEAVIVLVVAGKFMLDVATDMTLDQWISVGVPGWQS
jgi:hypothetical protein